MTTRNDAPSAASIRQKLLNLAKQSNEDFQQILIRYALERLLYRLGQSPYREQFVLKGALLFRLWFDLQQRPTRDADFLGFGDVDPENMVVIFHELVSMRVLPEAEDGLVFLADTVKAVPIRKEAGYPGIRVSLSAQLAGASIPVQCDIGFGDAVTPSPLTQTFPTLLTMQAPVLRVYPLETVVAEKLEALIKLAGFNSRMKDFFDLWLLMKFEPLDKNMLPQAIIRTFARRQTILPENVPTGLSPAFAAEKQIMWQSFLKRSTLDAPVLSEVLAELKHYYWPVLQEALSLSRREPLKPTQ